MVARLEDLQRSFLRHLRAEGRSTSTPRPYGQGVTYFSAWLVAQGRDADLDELSRPAIREWLAQLSERREPGTVRTRYRGLRRFCGWLVDEGELAKNPMETLSPPSITIKPVFTSSCATAYPTGPTGCVSDVHSTIACSIRSTGTKVVPVRSAKALATVDLPLPGRPLMTTWTDGARPILTAAELKTGAGRRCTPAVAVEGRLTPAVPAGRTPCDTWLETRLVAVGEG